jgi:hypothetical protein
MKLFVIVSAALNAGLKAAQGIHAFRAFQNDHPEVEQNWHTNHNNIVVLQDDDIPSLAARLEAKGFRISRFHEPDLDDELTAITAEPGAWKQLSSLPLAN